MKAAETRYVFFKKKRDYLDLVRLKLLKPVCFCIQNGIV